MPSGSHPARPMRRRPTSRLSTEQAAGTSASTECWGRQWPSLGTPAPQDLIQRPRRQWIAWRGLATPHAAAQQKLLISTTPACRRQQLGHRRIVEGSDQTGVGRSAVNPAQNSRQRLFQTRVPGHITNQFELEPMAGINELKTSGQNRFTGDQHTATGPAAIEEIQPMTILDLAQMAETPPLLDRPETLGIASIDRLPVQPLRQRRRNGRRLRRRQPALERP